MQARKHSRGDSTDGRRRGAGRRRIAHRRGARDKTLTYKDTGTAERDIDTHGFRILDQLRAVHPHVASMLMDEETLLAHSNAWGKDHRRRRPR